MICSHNVSYLNEQPDFYFAEKTILLMMIHFRTWVQSLATHMQLSLLIHCAHSTAPFGPLIGMDLRLSLWNVTDEHQRHSNNLQGKYFFFYLSVNFVQGLFFFKFSVSPIFLLFTHFQSKEPAVVSKRHSCAVRGDCFIFHAQHWAFNTGVSQSLKGKERDIKRQNRALRVWK